MLLFVVIAVVTVVVAVAITGVMLLYQLVFVEFLPRRVLWRAPVIQLLGG